MSTTWLGERGGGQEGPNFLASIPFNPCFQHHCCWLPPLCRLSVTKYHAMLSFLPPWESRSPHPVFPLPVNLSPPILLGFCHLHSLPTTCACAWNYLLHPDLLPYFFTLQLWSLQWQRIKNGKSSLWKVSFLNDEYPVMAWSSRRREI